MHSLDEVISQVMQKDLEAFEQKAKADKAAREAHTAEQKAAGLRSSAEMNISELAQKLYGVDAPAVPTDAPKPATTQEVPRGSAAFPFPPSALKR